MTSGLKDMWGKPGGKNKTKRESERKRREEEENTCTEKDGEKMRMEEWRERRTERRVRHLLFLKLEGEAVLFCSGAQRRETGSQGTCPSSRTAGALR